MLQNRVSGRTKVRAGSSADTAGFGSRPKHCRARATNRPRNMSIDGRSRLGRRVADLAEDFAQRLGGWASLSDTMIAQVRTNAFRDGNIDPIGLVRLGRTSARRGPLVETALAHVIGDKAEQAYRRSDALEKRRKLMEAWASYCEPNANSNVLHLRKC